MCVHVHLYLLDIQLAFSCFSLIILTTYVFEHTFTYTYHKRIISHSFIHQRHPDISIDRESCRFVFKRTKLITNYPESQFGKSELYCHCFIILITCVLMIRWLPITQSMLFPCPSLGSEMVDLKMSSTFLSLI